jgi:phosphoribosyl 1,2-cyclic phosphate phosphodiesterase
MQDRFLFLGTGASMGVPVIGCRCTVCSSFSSFNKRLRPSGLLHIKGKTFLIDVGPDFRMQALKYNVEHIDGILLTHTHFDHVAGIDDLRAFYFMQKKRLPCLLSKETFEELKLRYHYLMRPLQDGHSVSAQLDFYVIEEDFGSLNFIDVDWNYVSYQQAGMKITGYRLDRFAYISDIRTYTQTLIDTLKGVNVLVISALRQVPSEMHFSLEEAIAFARKVGAKKTWLTHIAHDLDHELTNRSLPSDIRLSYDGLEIPLDAP